MKRILAFLALASAAFAGTWIASPGKGSHTGVGGADALAGISFTARLQTYRGFGGTPNDIIGLYTDTACTTPATTAGDLIAGWKDEIFGSGLVATQATAGNRPTLQFVSGKPVLRFDTDDYLEISSSSTYLNGLTSASLAFCSTASTGANRGIGGWRNDIDDMYVVYLNATPNLECRIKTGGTTADIAPKPNATAGAVIGSFIRRAGPTSSTAIFNGDTGSITATGAWGTPSAGFRVGGVLFATGGQDCRAAFVYMGAWSAGDQTTINSFLSGL